MNKKKIESSFYFIFFSLFFLISNCLGIIKEKNSFAFRVYEPYSYDTMVDIKRQIEKEAQDTRLEGFLSQKIIIDLKKDRIANLDFPKDYNSYVVNVLSEKILLPGFYFVFQGDSIIFSNMDSGYAFKKEYEMLNSFTLQNLKKKPIPLTEIATISLVADENHPLLYDEKGKKYIEFIIIYSNSENKVRISSFLNEKFQIQRL